MKTLLTLFLAFAAIAGNAQSKSQHEHVRSYTKKNGTTVQAHERTTPDKTEKNNYSTKGNYNPSTGKTGTKTPKK